MMNSEPRASRQSFQNRIATRPATVSPSFRKSPASSDTADWIFSTSVVMWLISEPVLWPLRKAKD